MSNTPFTVYIPVPVSVKPDKIPNRYLVVHLRGTAVNLAKCQDNGSWIDYISGLPLRKEYTHWLKKIEITEESPVQELLLKVESWVTQKLDYTPTETLGQMLERYLPADVARSAYIKQLESEKQNIQPLLRELERIAEVYGYQETVDVINNYKSKTE
jgi:hypothetical protein